MRKLHIFTGMAVILLLSDFSRGTERDLIYGISKYADNAGGWTFIQGPYHLAKNPNSANDVLREASEIGADAIFGFWPGVNTGLVKESGIPVFLRHSGDSEEGITKIYSNHGAIGKMAAGYLLENGFKHLAYSGFSSFQWAGRREESFKEAAGKSFCGCIYFDDERENWDRITRWVMDLPKPCAIFSCNDTNARIIIRVCQSVALRVPEDIAVLGADNDEFLCRITTPMITSINLDYRKFGYRIGQLMDEVISGTIPAPRAIVNEPSGIVERQSAGLCIEDPLVRQVLKRMRARFTEGIGIPDVLEGIPLSRRSVELRFRKELGTTMHDYLTMLKIGRMKELLLDDGMSVDDAAFESGFSRNENYFRTFKSKVGCSPGRFRSGGTSSG